MPRTRTSAADPASEALHQLPKSIRKKLRALLRRVRRVQILRGTITIIATGILAVIAIMLINASFTILSTRIHATLSALALIALLITTYRSLYLPLRKPISLTHIARVIENRHPELQERLSTAISLLNSNNPSSSSTSKQLLAKVVNSAISDAKGMRPEREFTLRTTRKPIAFASAALAVIALALSIFPAPTKRLLTRAVAPFSKVGNAYAERLHFTPGDLRIPFDHPVTINLTVRGANNDRAELYRTNPGQNEIIETMTLVNQDPISGESEFSITFPSVTSNFQYRIRCGRAISDPYAVTVLTRPEIRHLEITYQFPAYTGLKPLTVEDPLQPISALETTEIQIRAHFDRPLDSVAFRIDGNPIPTSEQHLTDPQNPRAQWNFTLLPDTDTLSKLLFTDPDGTPSQAIEIPIASFADQAPRIELQTNVNQLTVHPNEFIPLSYFVEEDFGITAVTLHRVGDQHPIELPLPTQTANTTFSGMATIDVGKITPPGVDTFEVYLQVKDTRPESQIARTDPIAITIDSRAESLAEQFVNQQRDAIHAALGSAIEHLQEARLLVQPIAGELLKPDQIPTTTLKSLTRIQSLISQAETLSRKSAVTAAEPTSLFKSLVPVILRATNTHMVPARQTISEVPLTDKKITRVHRTNTASREIDLAIADLQVAIRNLKQRASRAQLLAKMSSLEEQQRQIAQALANTTDPTAQQQLQSQQTTLSDAIDKLTENSKPSTFDQLQDAREQAGKLATAAANLSNQQATLTRLLNMAQDPALRDTACAELSQLLSAQTENPPIANAPTLSEENLDQTLALYQNSIAAQSTSISAQANLLRQAAEPIAASSTLQQVQAASTQANQASQSALQASAQLNGRISSGAFDLAPSPGNAPSNQDRPPTAQPSPTQEGGGEHDLNEQPPDMSAIEGAPESPFSNGTVAANTNPTPPPISPSTAPISGGSLPTSPPQNQPSSPSPSPPSIQSTPSGEQSAISAAQQPALQAQYSLASAATALANASSALAQQAAHAALEDLPELDQSTLDPATNTSLTSTTNNNTLPSTSKNNDPSSTKNWQKINGSLRSGIASGSNNRAPEEYRDLVKHYFKEIARRSRSEDQ